MKSLTLHLKPPPNEKKIIKTHRGHVHLDSISSCKKKYIKATNNDYGAFNDVCSAMVWIRSVPSFVGTHVL